MTDSRAALLDAAAEEFARHGLHGTRVQAIVKLAGVNERMIYHHFGSKEGLYRAVLEAERHAVAEAWSPYLAKSVTMEPVEGMRLALAAFFDIMVRLPRLVALLSHEWLAGSGADSMPTADQLPQEIRQLYERGQRSGAFPPGRPFELAYGFIMGSLVGLSIFLPRFGERVDLGVPREQLRDHVVSQLLDGLTG